MIGKKWLWVAAYYKTLLPIITSGLGKQDTGHTLEPDPHAGIGGPKGRTIEPHPTSYNVPDRPCSARILNVGNTTPPIDPQ